METLYHSVPHPHLKEPTIYIVDLPKAANHASWKQISGVFASCGAVTSGGKMSIPGTTVQRWKVCFQDIFHAEMALVTLSGREVPGISPPWFLSFSHSLSANLPMQNTTLLPLAVRFSAKDGSSIPDAQTLFRWLRRAGPLYSLHMSVDTGYAQPVCVVEYWQEEHLRFAQTTGPKIHPVANKCLLSPFRAFDPWNLYCTGMGPKVQSEAFLAVFSKFGTIITGQVIKAGTVGFVSFMKREDAARAMHEMRAKHPPGWGNKLTARYHEPQDLSKLRPHPKAFLTRADWFKAPPSVDTATGAENDEQKATQKARDEDVRAREIREQETRKKEARENLAPNEMREAANKSREIRAEAARTKRVVAELLLRKASEAGERIAQKESAKLKEAESIHEADDAAEKELQLAEFSFENLKKLYDAGLSRLTRAKEASEKATQDKEEVDAALQSIAAEREALEAERLEAQKTLEEALQAERDAQIPVEEELSAEEQEQRRQAELAESIRKMAELREQEEADRRKLDAKKREEEIREARRKIEELEAQERRRAQEQKEREERAKEAATKAREERERRAREDAEKQARDLREKAEKAKAEAQRRRKNYEAAAAQERLRCKTRDEARWPKRFPWLHEHALARFRLLSTEFDTVKFCDTQPLTFESVPWPVLYPYHALTIGRIDWQAVEDFFAKMELRLSANDYRVLVEKTHRRFHPDKWRSRGLLATICDEAWREQLENAGNIVAQAMTPIWLASRSPQG